MPLHALKKMKHEVAEVAWQCRKGLLCEYQRHPHQEGEEVATGKPKKIPCRHHSEDQSTADSSWLHHSLPTCPQVAQSPQMAGALQ